jgi:hypothetical protein
VAGRVRTGRVDRGVGRVRCGAGRATLGARGGSARTATWGWSRLVGDCDGLTSTAATQTTTTTAALASSARAACEGLRPLVWTRRARRLRGARRTAAWSGESAAAPTADAAAAALPCALSSSRAACSNQSSSPRATSSVVVLCACAAAGASTSSKKASRSSPISLNRSRVRKGGNRCDRGPRHVPQRGLTSAETAVWLPGFSPAGGCRHRARMLTVAASAAPAPQPSGSGAVRRLSRGARGLGRRCAVPTGSRRASSRCARAGPART